MKTDFKKQWPLALGVAMILISFIQATGNTEAGELTLDAALAKARKGDPQAEYFLGKLYLKGNAVQRDDSKAAAYLRQAADQGYAFAQTDLAALYANGQGVKQDDQEAARWYLKAANKGDPVAQYGIGLCYSLGRGVTNDFLEALKWFKRAGDQKQPDALLSLGNIYLKGCPGISINLKEAQNWFEKLRDLGNLEADNSLGFINEYGGSGIQPNPQLALKYYGEAALAGNSRAEMNMGRLYLDGDGVKTDVLEAYKWFYVANQNGEPLANHYLRQMEGRILGSEKILNDAQKAEAIRRAIELLKTMSKPA